MSLFHTIDGTQPFRMPSVTPSVETLDISWWVDHFDSIDMAIDAAEKIAVDILMEDSESSWDWAAATIRRERDKAHGGDCAKARSWMIAPITCMACVYDDAMLKAWQRLKSQMLPEG